MHAGAPCGMDSSLTGAFSPFPARGPSGFSASLPHVFFHDSGMEAKGSRDSTSSRLPLSPTCALTTAPFAGAPSETKAEPASSHSASFFGTPRSRQSPGASAPIAAA